MEIHKYLFGGFDIEALFFSLENDILFEDENFIKDVFGVGVGNKLKAHFLVQFALRSAYLKEALQGIQIQSIRLDLTIQNPKPPILLSEF